ncbi:MAG: putative capsular polysaccharide synthesis family protein, partial [Bacteroidota bacterium]
NQAYMTKTEKILNNFSIFRFFTRRYRLSQMRKRMHQNGEFVTPAFVYQMGKVASMSVYRSLRPQYRGVSVHGHRLLGPGNHQNERQELLYELWKEEGFPIKIISMFRDPISRNFSSFFQGFKIWTGQEVANTNLTAEECYQFFMDNYPHYAGAGFFDNRFKPYFGLDVYEEPYNGTGHQFYKKGQVEMLLMRFDLENSKKEELISEYLGMDSFRITNQNIGSNKAYAHLYKGMKAMKVSVEYLDGLLSTKYVKHFFSEAEIQEIRQKWSRN